MLKIREAVIVEGRYDKIKLSSIVDAPIIETNGFRVFSDKEKQSLIRKIADNGSCVIVGRAVDYVLKDYKNVIRVFYSRTQRVPYCQSNDGLRRYAS